jgi:anti-sigma factor RsiW
MTNPSFNPDDPRLTAFVLGELDAADHAAVEQLLEASPEAQAFVDDLQDTIGLLRDAD